MSGRRNRVRYISPTRSEPSDGIPDEQLVLAREPAARQTYSGLDIHTVAGCGNFLLIGYPYGTDSAQPLQDVEDQVTLASYGIRTLNYEVLPFQRSSQWFVRAQRTSGMSIVNLARIGALVRDDGQRIDETLRAIVGYAVDAHSGAASRGTIASLADASSYRIDTTGKVNGEAVRPSVRAFGEAPRSYEPPHAKAELAHFMFAAAGSVIVLEVLDARRGLGSGGLIETRRSLNEAMPLLPTELQEPFDNALGSNMLLCYDAASQSLMADTNRGIPVSDIYGEN